MHTQKRTPNKNGEFLLDFHLSIGSHRTGGYVYDITRFFPHWDCRERNNYLERVTHTITGRNFTCHIIDYDDALTTKQADKLARDWYDGHTTKHRLD